MIECVWVSFMINFLRGSFFSFFFCLFSLDITDEMSILLQSFSICVKFLEVSLLESSHLSIAPKPTKIFLNICQLFSMFCLSISQNKSRASLLILTSNYEKKNRIEISVMVTDCDFFFFLIELVAFSQVICINYQHNWEADIIYFN